jgi:hypothetical protein
LSFVLFIISLEGGLPVLGSPPFCVLKPIQDIKPTEVIIADANNCKKNIYYSPVYFQPVKGKKVLSTIIAPIGKTIQKGNKDYDI